MSTTDVMQHRATAALRMGTGVLARTASHLRQFLCGLHGHDALLHFERDRLSLLCTTCGHETSGWDIRRTSEAASATTEHRTRVLRMPLPGQRHAA